MAWLKIDDNAPGHKKLLKVPPAARWLWVCGLAYCQRLKTDGAIPAEALDTFAVKNPKPLASSLVDARLWHVDADGYTVHDFLDWNESAEQREAKSEEKGERQRKWREGRRGETRLQVATVDASTRTSADATPPPLPTPLPTPTPQPLPQPPPKMAQSAEVRGGLAMSSLDFHKLQRFNAYVGARLRIPNKLHGDFIAALGGHDTDARLRAWYAELDAEIEASGEAILPDVWKWTEARFKDWATTTAEDAEFQAMLAKAAAEDAAEAAEKAARGQR